MRAKDRSAVRTGYLGFTLILRVREADTAVERGVEEDLEQNWASFLQLTGEVRDWRG